MEQKPAYQELEKRVHDLEQELDKIRQTELKESQEELRESEIKFRDLSDSTVVGIMIYQDDYWIYANPAAEKISGYTSDELKQLKFWEITAPEYVDLIIGRGKARQKGTPTTSGYEFKIVTKQGEEKWVFLSGNTTELKSGKAGLITVVDITEQKRIENKLRESEEYIKTILGSVQAGVAVIEEDTHKIKYVNSCAAGMTGMVVDDMVGKVCH